MLLELVTDVGELRRDDRVQFVGALPGFRLGVEGQRLGQILVVGAGRHLRLEQHFEALPFGLGQPIPDGVEHLVRGDDLLEAGEAIVGHVVEVDALRAREVAAEDADILRLARAGLVEVVIPCDLRPARVEEEEPLLGHRRALGVLGDLDGRLVLPDGELIGDALRVEHDPGHAGDHREVHEQCERDRGASPPTGASPLRPGGDGSGLGSRGLGHGSHFTG